MLIRFSLLYIAFVKAKCSLFFIFLEIAYLEFLAEIQSDPQPGDLVPTSPTSPPLTLFTLLPHPRLFAFLTPPGTFLPQGLCICCSLYVNTFLPNSTWFDFQVSAQMLPEMRPSSTAPYKAASFFCPLLCFSLSII